jgi:TRAP-type C4-dicarboxylate transport system substrate-binding protein
MAKRDVSGILCCLLVVLILAPVMTVGAAELKPRVLRFASAWPPPENSMISTTHKMWMDEVTRLSDGKITFRTYFGGAMGKPAEHLSLVERGLADVVGSNAHYTPGLLPLGQFEYVFPLGPENPVVVVRAKRQVMEEFPEFAADLAKYNAVSLMVAPGAMYQVLSKPAVNRLEDLRGKKITLIGRYFGRWFEPLGAVPVVAPGQERYTMLQTGVVEMDLMAIDLQYAFKLSEQAKHFVGVNALLGTFGDLWINKKTLESFPPEIQKMMLQAGKEIELKAAETIVAEWTKKILASWKAEGVSFYYLTPEERAKWASLVEDIPSEWAREVEGQGYPGFAIVKRFQDLCEQYGYKWPRRWGEKKEGIQ